MEDRRVLGVTSRITMPFWVIYVLVVCAWFVGYYIGHEFGDIDGWSRGNRECEDRHEQSRKERQKEKEQQDEVERAYQRGLKQGAYY
jgi:hypothetical protein